MSAATAGRIRALAVDTATQAAWAQWASLGAPVVTDRGFGPRSVVDPEALVLVSLAMSEAERRMEDVLEGWAHEGVGLLSVQRLQSLAVRFPETVQGRIGDLARYAVQAGDRRWSRLARPRSSASPTPRGKPFGPLDLRAGPALMLRMRAGFGVGSKGDVLTFLLANDGHDRSVRSIVRATAYTDRAVRTALEEMTRAGFVAESGGRPSTYRADPRAWARLLGFEEPTSSTSGGAGEVPSWRFWASIYGFLTSVAQWSEGAQEAEWSDYVLGSRARTLLETYQDELRTAGFDMEISGPAPADGVVALMERFREWIWASL